MINIIHVPFLRTVKLRYKKAKGFGQGTYRLNYELSFQGESLVVSGWGSVLPSLPGPGSILVGELDPTGNN